MSQARNHLQAVSPTGSQHQHAIVTNQLVKQFNRQDTDTFAPICADDTGTATAYAIAPVPGIKFYVKYQTYIFKALHANTGTTPTLNVNGLGAGTITREGGAALAVGDIALGDFVSVICTSTTPTFQLISQAATPGVMSGATTYLGTDVNFGTGTTFQNGPNTGSIGVAGWVVLVMATAELANATGLSSTMEVAIFDGTNYHSAVAPFLFSTEGKTVTVQAVITLAAATTFTLRARNNNGSSGASLQTTGNATGVANQATSISYVRIA